MLEVKFTGVSAVSGGGAGGAAHGRAVRDQVSGVQNLKQTAQASTVADAR